MGPATEALSARAKMLQDGVIKLAGRIGDSRLRERLGPNAPPIAFHLWHMARWADRLQARASALVPATAPGCGEIWIDEHLAETWRIDVPLGTFDSGMEMGDEASAALVLPTTPALMSYLARALDAAYAVFSAARDEDLALRGRDLYDRESTLAAMLVGHLTHLNRHLGMIEALVGVGGERGTASV